MKTSVDGDDDDDVVVKHARIYLFIIIIITDPVEDQNPRIFFAERSQSVWQVSCDPIVVASFLHFLLDCKVSNKFHPIALLHPSADCLLACFFLSFFLTSWVWRSVGEETKIWCFSEKKEDLVLKVAPSFGFPFGGCRRSISYPQPIHTRRNNHRGWNSLPGQTARRKKGGERGGRRKEEKVVQWLVVTSSPDLASCASLLVSRCVYFLQCPLCSASPHAWV